MLVIFYCSVGVYSSLQYYLWTRHKNLLFLSLAILMIRIFSLLSFSILLHDLESYLWPILLIYSIKAQNFLTQIEGSRDKLEKFFNYNFLYFEDD